MRGERPGIAAAAIVGLALIAVDAVSCGGGGEGNTNPVNTTTPDNSPNAHATIDASPTAIATETQIVDITPTAQATATGTVEPLQTALPSSDASATSETSKTPTHAGIKTDLEQLLQNYPEAEKILTSAIETWDRGQVHEEAGNLGPASNDYHSIFDKLMRLYGGFYAQTCPNMVCQPQLLTTAQMVESFFQASFPSDWYSRTKQAGWWNVNDPVYGPGCNQ